MECSITVISFFIYKAFDFVVRNIHGMKLLHEW